MLSDSSVTVDAFIVANGERSMADKPLLTAARLELFKWFKETAPSLAPAYEGTLRLLADTEFPGRLNFISHAIRDIADRLVFVLDDELSGSRVNYENHLDTIVQIWTDGTFVGQSSAPRDSVPIPVAVFKRLDRLLDEHRQRRRRRSNQQLLFETLMRNHPLPGVLNRRLVDAFERERKWFMERTHLRKGVPKEVPEAELQYHFRQFERMLHSFVGDFFTTIGDLDDILQEANRRTS
jgi:hypothetical protein